MNKNSEQAKNIIKEYFYKYKIIMKSYIIINIKEFKILTLI